MNVAKIHNNQIKAGSGFTIAGEYPIDDRDVVQSRSDLDTFVTSKVAYEGMQVYVIEEKRPYEYVNGTWRVVRTITTSADTPQDTFGFEGDIWIVVEP